MRSNTITFQKQRHSFYIINYIETVIDNNNILTYHKLRYIVL
jgi:hypothetical protein